MLGHIPAHELAENLRGRLIVGPTRFQELFA